MDIIVDKDTVIAADKDGTLSVSKLPIAESMATTLSDWLLTNRFVVISGLAFEHFEKHIISQLPPDTHPENLYLFPTNGASCYAFREGAWTRLYEETLTKEEEQKITAAIEEAVQKSHLEILETFGPQIENRGGQISFSGLGQDAPLSKKEVWDPDQSKRLTIVTHLTPLLPEFKIGIGGTTTIDITRKGIDMAFAISKMKEVLGVSNDQVVFFGDALFEGGNDWPATTTGIKCVKVTDEKDTQERIKELLLRRG